MSEKQSLRDELIEQRKRKEQVNKPAPERPKCKAIVTTVGAITYIIIKCAEVNNTDIIINDKTITALEILGGSILGNAIIYYLAHKPTIDKLVEDAENLAADIAALKETGPAPGPKQ